MRWTHYIVATKENCIHEPFKVIKTMPNPTSISRPTHGLTIKRSVNLVQEA